MSIFGFSADGGAHWLMFLWMLFLILGTMAIRKLLGIEE